MFFTFVLSAAVFSTVALHPVGGFLPPGIKTSITLEKTELTEGHDITGHLVLRNTTDQPVQLKIPIGYKPCFSDSAGKPISESESRTPARLCGLSFGDENEVNVPPRGESTLRFSVCADPLSTATYYRLPVGRYTISFPAWATGIVPDPAPVQFEITPTTNYRIDHRIRFVGFADDRVAVLREDGQLQSFSLSDGRRLASVELGNIDPPMPAFDTAEFAPDAKVLARVIQSPITRRCEVQLCDIADGAKPRTHSLAFVAGESGVPWLRGFDCATGALRVTNTSGVYEMNTTDGSCSRVNGWWPYSVIAPNGQFAISLSTNLRTRNGSEIVSDWPGSDARRLMGQTGVYGPTFDGSRAWRSYDGATLRTFEGIGGVPVAESPDGQRLVWNSASRSAFEFDNNDGELVVFSTTDQRRLWKLRDGKHRIVGFTNRSAHLASFTADRNSSMHSWLIDRVDIFDATTGACIRSFDLKPTAK